MTVSSRFGPSTLHQRDPRSALFDSYTGDRNRTASASPGGYGYAGSSGSGMGAGGGGMGQVNGAFRSATPNSRGQYSDAVLSELENQNDQHLEGISAKVKMLKDITVSIGDEIRSSSSLADTMNDSFDNTRVRLRGTMNRMLRMAEKTGVGWKVWVAFFVAVWLVFAYVWLF
ncbi:MAG: protein transport protein bet1 [Alectoria fallacina]|uniref:Protein transport protein bet1 n=1 Tax=Alectoria fallacina TaxID=1903189 RepID=A0A8H3FE91_9LECA|nr:MAG: protein transport protein bet1 [Alectoria fallacina]